MIPTDFRWQELATEAKVRPPHIFMLWHWLSAGAPVEHFAKFAGLEDRHVEQMMAALRAHELLPKPKRRAGPTGSPSLSGTRLPAVFQEPPEWIAWAQSERHWSEDIARKTLAEFVDYWHGIPGQRGVKLDWFATFRNWCRRSQVPDGIYIPAAKPETSAERRWLAEERQRLNNAPYNAEGEAEWTRRRDAAFSLRAD